MIIWTCNKAFLGNFSPCEPNCGSAEFNWVLEIWGWVHATWNNPFLPERFWPLLFISLAEPSVCVHYDPGELENHLQDCRGRRKPPGTSNNQWNQALEWGDGRTLDRETCFKGKGSPQRNIGLLFASLSPKKTLDGSRVGSRLERRNFISSFDSIRVDRFGW